MDSVIESLKESVKAIDKLPEQYLSDTALQLRTLTLALISELESDIPDISRIESLTEQVNELKG